MTGAEGAPAHSRAGAQAETGANSLSRLSAVIHSAAEHVGKIFSCFTPKPLSDPPSTSNKVNLAQVKPLKDMESRFEKAQQTPASFTKRGFGNIVQVEQRQAFKGMDQAKPAKDVQKSYIDVKVKFSPFSASPTKVTVKEIDRHKNADYYASDTLLSHLGQAIDFRKGMPPTPSTLNSMPNKFPSNLTFSKVVNKTTVDAIGEQLAQSKTPKDLESKIPFKLTLTRESNPEFFKQVLATPIGKMTINTLNSFNEAKGTSHQVNKITIDHSRIGFHGNQIGVAHLSFGMT